MEDRYSNYNLDDIEIIHKRIEDGKPLKAFDYIPISDEVKQWSFVQNDSDPDEYDRFGYIFINRECYKVFDGIGSFECNKVSKEDIIEDIQTLKFEMKEIRQEKLDSIKNLKEILKRANWR